MHCQEFKQHFEKLQGLQHTEDTLTEFGLTTIQKAQLNIYRQDI